MSMIETRLCQTTSQPHMTAALHEVAALERGIVLNEHYTFKDYINRRLFYLGNHAYFKSTNIRLCPIVRSNAYTIFSSEREELSVQEVRRREVRHNVVPLLPLPTTMNTDTIDSFQSYPQTEWGPTKSIPPTQHIRRPSKDFGVVCLPKCSPNSAIASPNGEQLTAFTREPPVDQSQNPKINNSSFGDNALPLNKVALSSLRTSGSILLETPNGDDFAAHGSAPLLQGAQASVKELNKSSMQPANATEPAAASAQTTELPSSHSSSSSPAARPVSSPEMSDQPSSHPTSPSPMASGDNATSPLDQAEQNKTEHPNQLQRIIATLGTGPSAPNAVAHTAEQRGNMTSGARNPDSVTVPEGVSSLASRAMPSPVKTMRGTKRPRNLTPDAAETSAPNDEAEDMSEIVQPPKKTLRLLNTRSPEEASTKTEKQPPTIKPKKASSSKPKQNHFDRVVAGTALPRSSVEAQNAARTRYNQLLEHNKARDKSRSRLAAEGDKYPNPDLLPEFFNTQNFPACSQRDQQVRCLCGGVRDDRGLTVQCDGCDVWQHIACIGEAIPKDMKKDDYFCQVCDPWAHRKRIAGLRRKNRVV